MLKRRTFLVFISVPAEAVTEDVEVLIEDAIKGVCQPSTGCDPASVEVVAAGSTRLAGQPRQSKPAAPGGQEPESLQGGVAPAVPAAGVPQTPV